MKTSKLQQARDYEKNQLAAISDALRPCFHLTPSVGWMNDPNGLSLYQGEYHLFYQTYPYSTKWNDMHWGHAKTRDFIHWERLPIAMAPDQEYDQAGCFSGTAVQTPEGRHMLLYTGVFKDEEKQLEYQTQCIAIGDGLNYEKYAGNPVITGKDVPEGHSAADFRDPKLWYDEELQKYFALVANRAADGSGCVLLYESEDGLHWKFLRVLDASKNQVGKMWECPDFFPLDGKQVLLLSPMNMHPQGLEFHPGHGTVAILGSYDKHTGEFTREQMQAIDYGIDFYAPQTVATEDGRRVMIGWMQCWATAYNRAEEKPWYAQMNLPRELTVREGRLYQQPVRELINYRAQRVLHENVAVQGEMALPGVSGRVLDMCVILRPGADFSSFTMAVAKDGYYQTTITYDGAKKTLAVDRSASGLEEDVVHRRELCVSQIDGALKLRLVMDKNSLELFVNDGAQAASFLVFTPPQAEGITFSAQGSLEMDVEKYDLAF